MAHFPTRAAQIFILSGHPDGGKIDELIGASSAFTTDYAPEEIFDIAAKLHAKL